MGRAPDGAVACSCTWPASSTTAPTRRPASSTGSSASSCSRCTLLLSFTGYLLPWDQLALWAVTVGTNMMGYTPVFGGEVRFVLLGGVEIGPETLLRWYVLHVLLLPVHHRHLHGHPLLAGPQGRRHLGTALIDG